MACHHHLMLAALAAFCGAALAMKPCSEADHAVNFITGEPCPDDAEKARRSVNVQPQIVTEQGHVVIKTGGVDVNVTDTISGAGATKLFASQDAKLGEVDAKTDAVQRRSEKNVADLLAELIVNEKNTKDAIDTNIADLVKESAEANKNSKAQSAELLKAMAEIAKASSASEAEGDKDKATGAAWYPLKGAKKMSDLGGDVLRINFPVGRELIADDRVKIYQCKFTLLDAKGSPTKDTRVSAAVSAETPRTFGCVSPQWGQGGALPKAKAWNTAVAVLENDRLMPSPKSGTTVGWVPNAPKAVFPNPSYKVSGGKNTKKAFSVDFKIDYPYGAAGFKDVRFKVTADSREVSDLGVGVSDSQARVLKFSVTTSQKKPVYKITIATSSASTGLSTSTSVTINFNLFVGLIGGAAKDFLTPEAAEALLTRAGCADPSKCSEEWKLCYSAKQHGWSSSTFNSRCTNKGKSLMLVQRRGSNKRISGAFYKGNYRWCGHYCTEGVNKKHFLWRVEPKDPKKVTIVDRDSSAHGGGNDVIYAHPSYLMCFGGGHDYCANNGGNSWHHTGHDYKRAGGNWAWNQYREEGNSYFNGAHSHNAKSEKDDYEVYFANGL